MIDQAERAVQHTRALVRESESGSSTVAEVMDRGVLAVRVSAEKLKRLAEVQPENRGLIAPPNV